MAWQDLAVKLLGSSDTEAARQRLLELDSLWESDFALIPDQEATRDLLALSKDVYLFPGAHLAQEGHAALQMDRLIELLDRVIESAQRKRRDLA